MKSLTTLIFLLVSSYCMRAQVNNPDSLMVQAKAMATASRYSEAIALLQNLQERYPHNRDYTLYLAHLYFWNQQRSHARKALESICTPECSSADALNLLLQIETADDHQDAVMALAEKGIGMYPEQKDHYLLAKAVAQKASGQDSAALQTLYSISKNSPEHQAAAYQITSILKKARNTLAAGYMSTRFDQSAFAPQHFAHLEYGRRFDRHTQLFRLNYAYAFGKSTLQVESDAYLKINKKDYLFLNAGISDNRSLFPLVKASAEYYRESRHISASIGGRYLHFDSDNHPALLTAHIGYTRQKWTINYRPYLLLLPGQQLFSHVGYARRSFPNRESYVQLDLQYGSLPYYYYTTDLLSRLNAYRIGISGKARLYRHYFIQPVLLYEREAYVPQTYRNRYTVQLILSKRF